MGAHDDEKTLAESLAALRSDLKKRLSGAVRAGKACEGLASASALRSLAALDRHLPPLRDADLAPFGLEERRAELVAGLASHQERLRAQARMSLIGELARAGQGVEVGLLTETPLTVLVTPLAVEVDLEAGSARVLYAREVVETCEPEAAAILAARQRAMDRIRAEALDSAAFFDLARRAYLTVLLARGLQPGERVDLVDLLGPLALLSRDTDDWRKAAGGGGSKGFAPYPRYLLAYQLQRLQRDGALAKDGARLELGAATAGSTRNKRDVLFVPSSATEGQYFLSIRFATQ
jgi:hypothetical protein